MIRKMIFKIIALPLILILTPVRLIGKLLLNASVFAGGIIFLLMIASMIVCIMNHDVKSSVMAGIFTAVGLAVVLAVGTVNVLLEDAMGTLLKFMVS